MITWSTVKIVILAWLVCLIPRDVCILIWELDIPLGGAAPYVFSRVLGYDFHIIKDVCSTEGVIDGRHN